MEEETASQGSQEAPQEAPAEEELSDGDLLQV